MESRQKYTKESKYDIDDFFMENLKEMDYDLSITIAEFIEKNLQHIPSDNIVSFVVGGLVIFEEEPVAFALELVRPIGANPILSDIDLITIDEYLDLMNLNLYIKSNEHIKN